MFKRAFIVAVIFAMASAAPAVEILSGATGMSCQALLCLSTGGPPAECAPALATYYAIRGVTPAETQVLRKAFLALCPTGAAVSMPGQSGTGDADLDRLVDVIVKGSDQVNLVNRPTYRDEHGNIRQSNYEIVYDSAAGQAYRDHPYTVDVPDNRGLYINGQKAIQENGKVYLESNGRRVEYVLRKGNYVSAASSRFGK